MNLSDYAGDQRSFAETHYGLGREQWRIVEMGLVDEESMRLAAEIWPWGVFPITHALLIQVLKEVRSR